MVSQCFVGRTYPKLPCLTLRLVSFWNTEHSRTSMARTSLGPWKFDQDMGSSSYRGLIMAPGLAANSGNLGKYFRFSTQSLYVDCTPKNRLHEAVLMNTNNIQFHDKIRKSLYIFVFLSCRKNFVGTQIRVRISHDKLPTSVGAIEVRLYCKGPRNSWFLMMLWKKNLKLVM